MKYNIVFAASADKQLQKFTSSVQRLIVKKISSLQDLVSSNSKGKNIKKLFGVPNLYRLRIGDYRVIYQVKDKELIILVLKIGHRKDVYRGV